MANTKISALTAATTPLDGTEVLPIVQSSTTKKVANNDLRPKQIQSNATSGVMQIVGPAAASTRVMTIPDANFTAARTDAANSFTGDQTLSTGNLIQGTAAKGINFTANTPAAGMTSQLLNWYEEGTWTPTISFSGASTGITYTTQTGLYTRIGRVVYLEAIITLSNKGSSTGDATVRGLPFTIGGTYAPAVFRPNTITYTGQTLAYFEPTTAYVVLSQITEAGVVSALTNTNFANGSQVMISGFYFV